MTAETSPLSPRHRYDAVYRSAERLLASQPPKPPRGLPARWLVFVLGLACGLAGAFLLLRTEEKKPTSIATPVETASTLPKRDRTHLNLRAPTETPSSVALTSTRRAEEPAATPAIVTPEPMPARPTRRPIAQRSAAPARSAAGTPMTPAMIITRFTTTLKPVLPF